MNIQILYVSNPQFDRVCWVVVVVVVIVVVVFNNVRQIQCDKSQVLCLRNLVNLVLVS